MKRREFLVDSLTVAACLAAPAGGTVQAEQVMTGPSGARLGNPIAVSTYSFWHFEATLVKIEDCIDMAADMGFDAVEILEQQMHRKDNAYLQSLKRQAHRAGLALCGLSAHQGFVSPNAAQRKANIELTTASIELAYSLGIPTIRVNTGRWGTTKDFDTLMKNRGVEPPLPGYTDEDAFPWVIDSFEKCLPVAEKRGVVLGLENHWGLARTPEGLLRIVNAVNSPWLGVTLDTGNFLEDPYERLEKIASRATHVHAKTYYGGGVWYTLHLDYDRIAAILRKHRYRGYISLEYEGQEPAKTAIPKSLAVLRNAFLDPGRRRAQEKT
jgi:L-ribulose-5-phosphate 3-epimerase